MTAIKSRRTGDACRPSLPTGIMGNAHGIGPKLGRQSQAEDVEGQGCDAVERHWYSELPWRGGVPRASAHEVRQPPVSQREDAANLQGCRITRPSVLCGVFLDGTGYVGRTLGLGRSSFRSPGCGCHGNSQCEIKSRRACYKARRLAVIPADDAICPFCSAGLGLPSHSFLAAGIGNGRVACASDQTPGVKQESNSIRSTLPIASVKGDGSVLLCPGLMRDRRHGSDLDATATGP